MRCLAAALALLAASCARQAEAPPPPPVTTAPGALEPGGLRPLTSRDAGFDPGPAPAAGPAISGRVELAPSLGARKGAALFVIARSAKTQEIVAVRKETAARFPLAFSISGADAMMEGTSFEGPLDLTARLSQSGDAAPASGDVEGVARALAPGARDVRIVLDSVRQ